MQRRVIDALLLQLREARAERESPVLRRGEEHSPEEGSSLSLGAAAAEHRVEVKLKAAADQRQVPRKEIDAAGESHPRSAAVGKLQHLFARHERDCAVAEPFDEGVKESVKVILFENPAVSKGLEAHDLVSGVLVKVREVLAESRNRVELGNDHEAGQLHPERAREP